MPEDTLSGRRHLDGDTVIGPSYKSARTYRIRRSDPAPRRDAVHENPSTRPRPDISTRRAWHPCRRAGSMRDDREPHPHLKAIGDRQQSFCCTGGDAGKIFTELAGDLVGKITGVPFARSLTIAPGGQAFDAVTAACAALKKGRFGDGSPGTQPVCPDRSSRLLARRILVKRKLPRGLGRRDDGVFQKIPPTIFRDHQPRCAPNYVTPSARNL